MSNFIRIHLIVGITMLTTSIIPDFTDVTALTAVFFLNIVISLIIDLLIRFYEGF